MQHNQVVKNLLITLLLTMVIMLGFSIYEMIQIPDGQRIPIQWNIKGQPSNYASKPVGLFILPVILLVTGTITSLVPIIDPRKLSMLKSAKAYQVICIAVFEVNI